MTRPLTDSQIAPPTQPLSTDGLFVRWTGNRTITSIGTNDGADVLAFQGWHHFKEAFAPEVVRRAVDSSAERVGSCIDPFGGSGTTALAAQMLGIDSTTIEVSPFLADVIRAKLATYDVDRLISAYAEVRAASKDPSVHSASPLLPATFIEPGVAGRWLFDSEVAARILKLLGAIQTLKSPEERRLFSVLVGGTLVSLSNVVVSGKGRRYRKNWSDRRVDPRRVDEAFAARFRSAIRDIYAFRQRPAVRSEVLCGDSRVVVPADAHDLALFSPPYPNSFDYTDVYNVELWMLGYLGSNLSNRLLRESTLTSHVQVKREFRPPPTGSRTLERVLGELEAVQASLWSPWIVSMVGGYFADMRLVLQNVRDALRDGGECWMVVGDSRYGGVSIGVADVIAELAANDGWSVVAVEPFRSMRSSPQQGGREDLPESLVVLR